MGDTHIAALAFHQRLRLKRVVGAGMTPLRPVMSHPHDHEGNIALT